MTENGEREKGSGVKMKNEMRWKEEEGKSGRKSKAGKVMAGKVPLSEDRKGYGYLYEGIIKIELVTAEPMNGIKPTIKC